MTSILCPVKPHELDKRLRYGIGELAEKVAAHAFLYNQGKDVFALIYMAGIYHGVELAADQTNGGART